MGRHFPKYPHVKTITPDWKGLIRAHSPYLSANLEKLETFPLEPSAAAFDAVMQEMTAALRDMQDTDEIMRLLREAKKKIATVTAVADLASAWDDSTVMQRLSDFADFCAGACLRHLLRKAHTEKKIRLPAVRNPEEGCGVTVIALGKWGACELNYSSDIDLMVIFDAHKAPVRDKGETQNFFIRLTRELARMLDQPTEDGYVFRTDLRLRPDPGAMPLAVSLETAEFYYGSLGQNWERAAMIKARPVAGDSQTGHDFMNIMKSWIWRKNLDFAAIQDIHSIKRQINARQKAATASRDNPFYGYNVKLGHGGIREIEFFVQTQQLIFGGRQPELRASGTLSALPALERNGHISDAALQALHDAYLFLRRVEHRLQMIDDRQTHSLPDSTVPFRNFAAFMRYETTQEFLKDLKRHTDAVKKLYAGLFTEEPSLSAPGNLVFTGVDDDPETLETLKRMGFADPGKVTAAVRGWHHGRYRAMRSEKARQILTELVPHLLGALAKTPHPDDAFIRFDAFLSRLPAGVPIFSMFARNPAQMELVADVMGTSPPLAEYLGLHPQVLDGVLTQDFFGGLPTLGALKAELSAQERQARDYEDVLDLVRRWAREKRFHAGIHILKGISSAPRAGLYLSDIAEAVISVLTPCVEEEFAKQHGRFNTGEFTVIAMGSFAARHMFFDSDLDLVGLYRVSPDEELSTGVRPLSPNAYYIRLMQRLLTALSAPTAEGVLYDTDTRLRPSGNDGPLASSFDAFFEYQRKEAWTWEHMSLIRSRPVYTLKKTSAEFESRKKSVLSRPRDLKTLRKEMLEMRAKVDKEFGSKDPWNLKYARGGIMDIMFAAHCLMLAHGVFHPDMETGLRLLRKKELIGKKDFDALTRALAAAEAAQGFLRLAAELPFAPKRAPKPLREALMRHTSPQSRRQDFAKFSADLKKTLAASYAAYRGIMK